MAAMFLTVLSLLAAASLLHGAAFLSKTKEMTIRYGTKDHERTVVRRYCEWNGHQVLLGSTWTTACCMHCTCTSYGLECYTHGVYMTPPGCLVLVNEVCEVEIVDSTDPNQPCQPLIAGPPGGVVTQGIPLEAK
ncbi:beta-microseminoprotein E1-like [Branchiostoma lanceolatum]|uniref:beta-microseminoprotein E1-like n=1 Tax=Branchiostoma lanceolatum TaxID=7740 RepID=UPI0034559B8B